ncbi:unnamed protein product [Phytomonas sp. Hart1]|nr:unnamed protein product [Phytomonas sp. Hart1]|eukprot:CCW68321.1 unnamed protein product [Phytomonas sp. isolate Hart1]
MPPRSRSASPQGRSELLRWLNGLCSVEYPAVTSLRDGVAYVTLVEAALRRIAANAAGCSLSEAPTLTTYARRAKAFLAKLDLSPTRAVCEGVEAARDGLRVQRACDRNLRLLQQMLRGCVPTKYRVEIDVERLVKGRLQDHVRLLQWLHRFMLSVLAEYSKSALKKKIHQESGKVEGVKLNRAIILLEEKRLEKKTVTPRRGGKVLFQPSEPRAASSSDNMVVKKQPFYEDPARFLRTDEDKMNNYEVNEFSASENEVPNVAINSLHLLQKGDESPMSPREVVSSTTPRKFHHTPRSHAENKKRNALSSSPFYQTGSVLIPEDFKLFLSNLRREVEALEGVVIRAHDNYFSNLTRRGPSTQPLEERQEEPEMSRENIPSLHELGELLEERDSLTQQFAAVDAVVQKFRKKGASTPLLTDLCSILHPSTMESEVC